MSYHKRFFLIPTKQRGTILIELLHVFFEQHSGNCSGIISPFIPLSGWTVSPQWLIREWFCANKRDSKIPRSNPRRLRERISSVKATGNLITIVPQSRETFDTIIRVHMQSTCGHTILKRQSDTSRIYGIPGKQRNTAVHCGSSRNSHY